MGSPGAQAAQWSRWAPALPIRNLHSMHTHNPMHTHSAHVCVHAHTHVHATQKSADLAQWSHAAPATAQCPKGMSSFSSTSQFSGTVRNSTQGLGFTLINTFFCSAPRAHKTCLPGSLSQVKATRWLTGPAAEVSPPDLSLCFWMMLQLENRAETVTCGEKTIKPSIITHYYDDVVIYQ